MQIDASAALREQSHCECKSGFGGWLKVFCALCCRPPAFWHVDASLSPPRCFYAAGRQGQSRTTIWISLPLLPRLKE